MRPAPRLSAPDVWIVREQACFKLWKPLFYEHPNPVLRTATVSPKPIRFAASFYPQKGKGISVCLKNSMLEISLFKPPARICSSCSVRPGQLNRQVWLKTAKRAAHADSHSWRCLPTPKQLRLLINSTV